MRGVRAEIVRRPRGRRAGWAQELVVLASEGGEEVRVIVVTVAIAIAVGVGVGPGVGVAIGVGGGMGMGGAGDEMKSNGTGRDGMGCCVGVGS